MKVGRLPDGRRAPSRPSSSTTRFPTFTRGAREHEEEEVRMSDADAERAAAAAEAAAPPPSTDARCRAVDRAHGAAPLVDSATDCAPAAAAAVASRSSCSRRARARSRYASSSGGASPRSWGRWHPPRGRRACASGSSPPARWPRRSPPIAPPRPRPASRSKAHSHALCACRHGLLHAPANLALLRLRGDVLLTMGDDSGAVAAYKSALRVAPSDQPLQNGLMVAMRVLEAAKEAEEDAPDDLPTIADQWRRRRRRAAAAAAVRRRRWRRRRAVRAEDGDAFQIGRRLIGGIGGGIGGMMRPRSVSLGALARRAPRGRPRARRPAAGGRHHASAMARSAAGR